MKIAAIALLAVSIVIVFIGCIVYAVNYNNGNASGARKGTSIVRVGLVVLFFSVILILASVLFGIDIIAFVLI